MRAGGLLTLFPLFLDRELGGRLFAKSLQSCLILCDSMDCSPAGSSVDRILQARILEWVAMTSSRESSRPRDQTRVSYVSCIGRQILKHLPRMTGKTRTRRGWIRTKKLENQSWQRLQALSEEEWLAGGGRQQPCVQRAACTERQMGAEPGKPAPVPPGACRPHVM